jgi:hypothetical protein
MVHDYFCRTNILARGSIGIQSHRGGYIDGWIHSRVSSLAYLPNYFLLSACRLGDRHGENILFDSTNGDTVHVDFNCLFEKVEAFQIYKLEYLR